MPGTIGVLPLLEAVWGMPKGARCVLCVYIVCVDRLGRNMLISVVLTYTSHVFAVRSDVHHTERCASMCTGGGVGETYRDRSWVSQFPLFATVLVVTSLNMRSLGVSYDCAAMRRILFLRWHDRHLLAARGVVHFAERYVQLRVRSRRMILRVCVSFLGGDNGGRRFKTSGNENACKMSTASLLWSQFET